MYSNINPFALSNNLNFSGSQGNLNQQSGMPPRAPAQSLPQQGYYGTVQQPYKGSYAYKQMQKQQQQRSQSGYDSYPQGDATQQSMFKAQRLSNSGQTLAPIDITGASYMLQATPFAPQEQQQFGNMDQSLEKQIRMRKQQKNLMRELKNIEKQNKLKREEKIFKLMENAVKQKKIKKIPPPLVPLPYHMVPKKLIQELRLKPPLAITTGKDKQDKKLTKKQRQQQIDAGLIDIEVYERQFDKEAGKYLDELSGFDELSSKKSKKGKFLTGDDQPAYKQPPSGAFLGLQKLDDEVTKILISKNDQLKDKLARQVVFGPDGPIEAPDGDLGPKKLQDHLNLLDQAFDTSDEEEQQDQVPLIDKLRQELAVDIQKQKALEQELNIPQFQKDEQVEVDEDEVSDDQDDDVDGDDANNKRKAEQYQIIKDRLKKNKGGNVDDIPAGQRLKVIFKMVSSLVQVLNEVKNIRIVYRDQGIVDFKNALPLYNEVLRGWLIKCVKTPVLTIIRLPDKDMDFTAAGGIGPLAQREKRDKFLDIRIRVNTIFQQLVINATPKLFPQPLMTFMNSFMCESGFVPYDFLTEFEQDMLDFDSSDALKDFGPKEKFLFIGSFIISQYLIDRILMRPAEHGFNTDISERSQKNLDLLAALIHGIFSEVMYDTFREKMTNKQILLANEVNRKEILEDYIYARYKYSTTPVKFEKLEYAFEQGADGSVDSNYEWWQEMKEQCRKFIILIYQLLEE